MDLRAAAGVKTSQTALCGRRVMTSSWSKEFQMRHTSLFYIQLTINSDYRVTSALVILFSALYQCFSNGGLLLISGL